VLATGIASIQPGPELWHSSCYMCTHRLSLG